MKQRRIRLVFTVILCILIIVPVYFRISQYLTIKNVYDEIYYDERGAINTSFLGRGNVSLGKVDGIESWNRADAFDEEFPVSEKYDKKSLLANMTNMSLSFFFKDDYEIIELTDYIEWENLAENSIEFTDLGRKVFFDNTLGISLKRRIEN